MGFHHVAIATRDLEATHRFYTEAMGFRLVKTNVAPTGNPGGGWAKHLFYDTGDGTLIAFWELHDDTLPAEYDTAISTGLGLPEWVNHIAFDAPSLDDLAVAARRWQEAGITVIELDHGWCTSIYATDPNGVLVEFCCTTAVFTAADAAEAESRRTDPAPPLEELATMRFLPALERDAAR
ncbi:MAG TPA: VOC family protein [Acidimicrobiales bacterium]|nr:VOC family protein [Acidimicrobiales bacterium]